eukprot:scaffold47547_cov34-Tisochrysis_lutea.AAC.1
MQVSQTDGHLPCNTGRDNRLDGRPLLLARGHSPAARCRNRSRCTGGEDGQGPRPRAAAPWRGTHSYWIEARASQPRWCRASQLSRLRPCRPCRAVRRASGRWAGWKVPSTWLGPHSGPPTALRRQGLRLVSFAGAGSPYAYGGWAADDTALQATRYSTPRSRTQPAKASERGARASSMEREHPPPARRATAAGPDWQMQGSLRSSAEDAVHRAARRQLWPADERRRCVELELNGNWDVSVHPPHRAREGVANERARRLVAWRSQLKHSTDVRVACHTCVASSDAQLDLSRRGGGGGEEEGDGARLPPERDEQRGRNPFRELCGERLLGGGTQGAVEGGRRLGLAWAGGGDGE